MGCPSEGNNTRAWQSEYQPEYLPEYQPDYQSEYQPGTAAFRGSAFVWLCLYPSEVKARRNGDKYTQIG